MIVVSWGTSDARNARGVGAADGTGGRYSTHTTQHPQTTTKQGLTHLDSKPLFKTLRVLEPREVSHAQGTKIDGSRTNKCWHGARL